jgi:hypothetical protein
MSAIKRQHGFPNQALRVYLKIATVRRERNMPRLGVAMQTASNSTQFSGAVWRFSICSCHERKLLILLIPKTVS